MSDFVDNPRRAPRALVGCEARVALRSGTFFKGPTVDCGPTGCQIVAPAPLPHDERLFVELRNECVPAPSFLCGRVAWTAEEAPFRLGVQFDAFSQDDAALFYGRLAAAYPDLVEVDGLPERLALDARVVPCDREGDEAVVPGEEELLLVIGSGISLRDLRERLGVRWPAKLVPLFALLARRLLAIEERRER